MSHDAEPDDLLYRQILENIDTDIALFDADCRYEYINPVAVKDPELRQWLIGKTDEEYCLAKGKDPAIGRNRMRVMREAMDQHRVTQMEETLVAKDGSTRHIVRKWCPVLGPGAKVSRLIGYGFDITDRKNAEEALRQSEQHLRQAQKMEAVGSLAGGIAHDFNNLLTAITCNCQTVLSGVDSSDPYWAEVDEIRKAAERAAVLTRQLLAFGRREMLQPKAVNLNSIVNQLHGMLRRLIPANIELMVDVDPALKAVRADSGQLEQVIVNLALNARDAMPDGGKLVVATRNVTSDNGKSVAAKPSEATHVLLSVSDTGHGMEASVQERAFEPFFTTKELSKGTGLGLSTVYSIVTQTGGTISLESDVGHGTQVSVLIPVADADPHDVANQRVTAATPGLETILVVEDEDSVRRVVRRILSKQGYRVTDARNGQEALTWLAEHDSDTDLVLTDIIMPEMGGAELAGRIRATWPGIKVLFMSGYSDDDAVRRSVAEAGSTVLRKPFTPDDLKVAVRHALDTPAERFVPR